MAATVKERSARAVNLRRGFARLGTGLVVLWLVYWTCAYVIGQPRSEVLQSPVPALSLTTDLALAASAILVVLWCISGFRS